ncbi:MAG: hypothetical protein KIS94_03290 [Chitinophagales bacterium]|nr:hypothetical protein [Chitinophagales bacterium]
MKKGLFVIALIIAAQTMFAQYSLTFCKEVSTEGKAQDASNTITASDKAGNPVKILVNCDEKLNAMQVEYRIFFVDENGKETEVSKLPQYVEPNWDFAWKKVTFYDPGTYRVKVYNENGVYLTSANLNVKQP